MTKNSVISLAVLVLAATAVQAQTKTTTLPNLRLVSTTLQVADAFQQISATCSTEGCTASTPVVKPINVLCPGSSGQTCIFKVHVVVGNLFATFNSIGAFQYVGDGTETPPEAGAGFVLFGKERLAHRTSSSRLAPRSLWYLPRIRARTRSITWRSTWFAAKRYRDREGATQALSLIF